MRWTGLAFMALLLLLGAGQPKKAEVKDPAEAASRRLEHGAALH